MELLYVNQYDTYKNNLEKKLEMLVKKIPDTSVLVTTTVLNTKITACENKIPYTSSLVTTTILQTKITEVENKIRDHAICITTQEFNKLTAGN